MGMGMDNGYIMLDSITGNRVPVGEGVYDLNWIWASDKANFDETYNLSSSFTANAACAIVLSSDLYMFSPDIGNFYISWTTT